MAATAGQGVAEHRVALLARGSLWAAPGGGASAGEATVGVAQRSAARMAADVHGGQLAGVLWQQHVTHPGVRGQPVTTLGQKADGAAGGMGIPA